MSVLLGKIDGAINQAREFAEQLERHIAQGSRPHRDELRAWRTGFANTADVLEAVKNEFECQHNEGDYDAQSE